MKAVRWRFVFQPLCVQLSRLRLSLSLSLSLSPPSLSLMLPICIFWVIKGGKKEAEHIFIPQRCSLSLLYNRLIYLYPQILKNIVWFLFPDTHFSVYIPIVCIVPSGSPSLTSPAFSYTSEQVCRIRLISQLRLHWPYPFVSTDLHFLLSFLRVFQTSFNLWSFTRAWVTANLQDSSQYFGRS